MAQSQRNYSETTQRYSDSVGGAAVRGIGWFLMIASIIAIIVLSALGYYLVLLGIVLLVVLIFVAIVGYALAGVYIISEWVRVPTLRLGKYKGLKGPGIFWLAPIIFSIPFSLDMRIITTIFRAEQTLTKDNVPVNVDAVLFWQVLDAYKASIRVQDYKAAITWAAQTSLRDIIGKTDLTAMLVGREQIAKDLQSVIDVRTEEWGVKSISVEIRDVIIPANLQDALSRQAQAERERLARITLASSEEQIAQKFLNAAQVYESDRTALNLRAMNILYESMKEKGAWVIVPSDLVNVFRHIGGSFDDKDEEDSRNA